MSARCQIPEICRTTTPPAEISRVTALAFVGTRSLIPELRGLLLNALPRVLHVARLRVGLADAEPKSKFPVELGMREIKVAAAVQPIHQELIRLISRTQAEADEVKLGGRAAFKGRIFRHP